MVVPIIKKGQGVEKYRKVTIMPIYKVYTAILAERIREEVKRKGLLPPNQMEFRKVQ